jgi:predicted amidohydrolase YtcJ
MAARLTAYLVALIVSVTFIAGLIVGAQRDDDGPVDLIVVNGSVYTADGDSTMAEAVAVQGNKILLVGSNREVQRLRRAQTVVVDAKGGAVLPGFNDASVDFITSSLALQQVNLADAGTLVAIESAIKGWAAANPERDWVVGHGWTPEAFGDHEPTRQMLDALVPDRPAFFVSQDGELGWANSTALKLAKVTRRTPNPESGTIVKDPRSGEPTGLLTDEAMELVTRVVPQPTREERLGALRAAIEEAHRRGVTSVQDVSASVDDLELYDELRRERALDLRVYAALSGHVGMSDDELDALDAVRAKYDDDPLFKTGAITLSADGAAEADLRDLVAELDERGWQVIIQAIGESAVQMARDAVEFASGKSQPAERGRRHRVEAADDFGDPVDGVQSALGEKRTLLHRLDELTRDAAWASFDEHRKGKLERDMLADVVVLTADIFAAPSERAADADVSVAVTIFDGRIVYTRPTESND